MMCTIEKKVESFVVTLSIKDGYNTITLFHFHRKSYFLLFKYEKSYFLYKISYLFFLVGDF